MTLPTSLNEERVQTDSSLVNERDKTDNSFADHKQQTESDTDKRVKSDRQGADQARAQSRFNTDATTDLARSGRSELQQNRTTDEKTADNSLRDQRNRDDAAVISERILMDAALVRERDLNDSESNKFLARERKETDRNLLRERKHSDTEAQTERSSHLATKAALTSRDELLAIVSHDLRNPIGAILSYVELLLEETDRNEKDSKTWAEVIKRNAKTSLNLINDILDMERFAEGKLTLNLVPCDFERLIRDTLQSFLHVATAREITLTAVPSQKNSHISCDRDRIAQVLANLIGNALKFTPKGGSVTISTQYFENEIRVSIADTGIGIAGDLIHSVFDRYTQLGDKNRQGLGLGLYISKMLVDAHHGKIDLVSTLGKGSTFSFQIPCAPYG